MPEPLLRFFQEGDLREPGNVLVAGAFGTAIPAALLVEPPGTNLILWADLRAAFATGRVGQMLSPEGIRTNTILFSGIL
ncbi:hypothetical protein FGW20_05665 [Methanoculleus sp. FWC-SCC3]|uniref:Uncharacterized protein n=1 Tax=Methanoculleus methanifontis TaxID=2584086 RepID=A0ABT8M1K1_9EURY|nr:hypothetical protein [Methanoculleus sp. FWC-SCC3]MDN7012533.1 hypothetical protein [Methanoculleus sp. FWC-SCC3]